MIVKINGSVFDTERVMRFAPHKKDGLDFQPDDICSRESLKAQQEYVEKQGFEHWTVNRMGWMFLFWSDGCGNTFPQCFAPSTGKLEIPEQA